MIVGCAAPPPGETLWQQSRFIARDGALRNFVLNEPRGGVFRHVNLLVPAKDPRAQMGFIIMEPEDTPAMCGSRAICVATVLLDAGILPMQEPETHLVLEAPGGLIAVTAECRNGKAGRIAIENVHSFVERLEAPLEVKGLGSLEVDIACGGDSSSSSTRQRSGSRFSQTKRAIWPRPASASPPRPTSSPASPIPRRARAAGDHIYFCQFAGPLAREGNELRGANACVIRPGKIDRSPTGTGCSARMATLSVRGLMTEGDVYRARSIIGSEFVCRIAREVMIGGRPAIIPIASGRGWITGVSQYMLDPDDPWHSGYRLSDTWPRIGEAI